MVPVLRKNLPLKILSVSLAFFLWFVISGGRGGEEIEISLGLPVELHNLPPEMEVVQGPVERVNVRFSGPRRLVSGISKKGLNIRLDLTGTAEGVTTFELFTSDIEVPEGVTVSRVSPSSVNVQLEKTLKIKVPINLSVEGDPLQSFKALDPVITPDALEIKGPRSIVREVKVLNTAPVSVEAASRDVVGETSVILPEEGDISATNRSTIKYRIPVVKVKQNGQDG